MEEDAYSIISILEEYCETVFQIYEALNCNLFCKSKVYKLLKRKLTKLENSIKNEISTKIEIVFLPYKASMWDSFESIYFAAKEDPNCNGAANKTLLFIRLHVGCFFQKTGEGKGKKHENISKKRNVPYASSVEEGK